MTPWLAPAVAVGLAVVLFMSFLLYRDLRQAERLSKRLRMACHAAEPIGPHERAERAVED